MPRLEARRDAGTANVVDSAGALSDEQKRCAVSDSLIVACPACNTLNRAPREKLAAGSSGKCGQCGSPLFEGHPVALNAQSFETHAAKSDIPLLVDFWAPWCGPCKAMAPQFEKAAGQLEPRVRFAKVNTDEEQQLAGRFGIQGIPTMILFSHGKEIARQSGMMNAAGIEQLGAAVTWRTLVDNDHCHPERSEGPFSLP